MFRRILPLVIAVSACDQPGVPASDDAGLAPLPRDVHSYAQPEKARVTHVSLDLTPDFAAKRLSGTARLAVTRAAGADSVVLDVRDIEIKKVTDTKGAALGFSVGTASGVLGAPLSVALPSGSDTVVIEYATSPDAAAVQWLAPEQTAGGKLPFLFTQGQAILTRTWVPTQDGPGIRQTYDATVRVPAGMRAVMSAEQVGEAETDSAGLVVYRYRMPNAIPPYLIALAVGDIAFRPIGSRTGVYAEPSVVERAASEFTEVDQMIAAAEKLYGPYRWGRYDILVLPPAFPFGGMENPTLTFATPTILAGDRSLVSLVAHELAHSWSGNLVTNATWDDFWINEGFTTYIESRIMEELRGKPYADMLRQLGRQDMMAAVEDAGGPQGADTRLNLQLTASRNPDDGMTDIAYEKGAAFLHTVESVVGRERLDTFLKNYFDRFAFQPMSSERLVTYMEENLLSGDEASRIGLRQWIFEPGIPSNIVAVQSDAFTKVEAQVAAWKNGAPASALQTEGWTTQEWMHFLRTLPDTIPAARLANLDNTFRLSSSGNSEVLFAWLRVAIRNRYDPSFPALEKFLMSQGRRKFVAPLYEDLAKTEWGRRMANNIYRRARPTYHSVSTGTIDRALNWPGGR
jgi:leukotriene-A4 hydrolase